MFFCSCLSPLPRGASLGPSETLRQPAATCYRRPRPRSRLPLLVAPEGMLSSAFGRSKGCTFAKYDSLALLLCLFRFAVLLLCFCASASRSSAWLPVCPAACLPACLLERSLDRPPVCLPACLTVSSLDSSWASTGSTMEEKVKQCRTISNILPLLFLSGPSSAFHSHF